MTKISCIKKILITGGSGMVGSNLRAHHLAQNYQIFAPKSKKLDLTDYQNTLRYLKKINPDVVIHAAGKVGGIQANIENPVEFLEQNSAIGRNIIMASYNAGIPNFLNLASTCIYPKHAQNPLSENQILTGALEPTNEGYALAKIMALRLCEYIQRANVDLQYKTLIPCNLYGPFDKFDITNSHLIPSIIHKIHQAKSQSLGKVEIWGDGTARREFMYAEDLADAVYCALEDLSVLPLYVNCGVGFDYSVNDYYKIVSDVIEWDGNFKHDTSRAIGMMQKLCDTKLQKTWGWKPKTSLIDGVRKTYKFYLKENSK